MRHTPVPTPVSAAMVRWLIHASMPFCPVLASVTRTRRWQSRSAAENPRPHCGRHRLGCVRRQP
jgi:hypothetical protein